MTATLSLTIDNGLDDTAATRRAFLQILAAAGLLTACGTDDDGSATPAASYRVTVTTPDDGEVTLTVEPRRLVALNGNRVLPFLQPFLDERHEIVGYGGEATGENFPWIAEELASAPNVVIADGPPLETLAQWNPDLFIGNGNLGDYWEPVREIGPLVQLPETDWRATVTLLGEIFEQPETAAEVIAAAEQAIDEARLEAPVTAAVLSRYQDNGTLGFQVKGAELPNFLADLGIEVAESSTAVDGYEDISLETAGERLDVDWVIILNYGDDLQASLLEDPVFTSIPAIAEGRYVALDSVQTGAGFPVTPPTIPVVIDALAPILEG